MFLWGLLGFYGGLWCGGRGECDSVLCYVVLWWVWGSVGSYGVVWEGMGLSGGFIVFYAWGDGNLWSRTGPHVEGMGSQEILWGLGSHEVYGVL